MMLQVFHFVFIQSELENLAEDQRKLGNCVKTLQEQVLAMAEQNHRMEQILGKFFMKNIT